MHCTFCGTTVTADARFCPRCGKEQPGAAGTSSMSTPMAPAAATSPGGTTTQAWPDTGEVKPGSRTPLIAGALGIVALAFGGFGYWGWEKHVEAEEAARKVAEMEKAAALMQRQNAQATQTAQTAAAEAARAAEETERLAVAVAQAALDKAIAAEEEQARTRLASATR